MFSVCPALRGHRLVSLGCGRPTANLDPRSRPAQLLTLEQSKGRARYIFHDPRFGSSVTVLTDRGRLFVGLPVTSAGEPREDEQVLREGRGNSSPPTPRRTRTPQSDRRMQVALKGPAGPPGTSSAPTTSSSFVSHLHRGVSSGIQLTTPIALP